MCSSYITHATTMLILIKPQQKSFLCFTVQSSTRSWTYCELNFITSFIWTVIEKMKNLAKFRKWSYMYALAYKRQMFPKTCSIIQFTTSQKILTYLFMNELYFEKKFRIPKYPRCVYFDIPQYHMYWNHLQVVVSADLRVFFHSLLSPLDSV